MLRIATPADAISMLEIYTPFILNTGITQEVDLPTVEEFRQRIETGSRNFPWLVAEEEGKLLGYAYASKHRERAGYQWCVETSIYIHPEAYGSGIARQLYLTLLRFLQHMGYHNAYAVITLPNPASIRFHEKTGFEYFTTFEKIGFKLGQWHDVGWMRYTLKGHTEPPQPPISFHQLESTVIQSFLEEGTRL